MSLSIVPSYDLHLVLIGNILAPLPAPLKAREMPWGGGKDVAIRCGDPSCLFSRPPKIERRRRSAGSAHSPQGFTGLEAGPRPQAPPPRSRPLPSLRLAARRVGGVGPRARTRRSAGDVAERLPGRGLSRRHQRPGRGCPAPGPGPEPGTESGAGTRGGEGSGAGSLQGGFQPARGWSLIPA